MGTKKVIRRNLLIENYTIVDTFSLGEGDYVACDNCGRPIKNVAVIKSDTNQQYNVGLDCAQTLSGISEWDIDRHNDKFSEAKRILAKVRKHTKLVSHLYVSNSWYSKDVEVVVATKENPTCGRDYYMKEEVDVEFLKKYLPNLAKIAMVNFDFEAIDSIDEDSLNFSFRGYDFKGELKSHENSTSKYAYAEIYKDGVMLCSNSNGGSTVYSVVKAATTSYNQMEFKRGLKPLIEVQSAE